MGKSMTGPQKARLNDQYLKADGEDPQNTPHRQKRKAIDVEIGPSAAHGLISEKSRSPSIH